MGTSTRFRKNHHQRGLSFRASAGGGKGPETLPGEKWREAGKRATAEGCAGAGSGEGGNWWQGSSFPQLYPSSEAKTSPGFPQTKEKKRRAAGLAGERNKVPKPVGVGAELGVGVEHLARSRAPVPNRAVVSAPEKGANLRQGAVALLPQ